MKHTSLTDIPLSERGKKQAALLGSRLEKVHFSKVFSSPLQRAWETCQLAGFAEAVKEARAVEWDYGNYEGLTSEEIHRDSPAWTIFTHGAPGGESVEQVGKRADQLIETIRQLSGNVALFSHGHFMRVFAARWLGLKAGDGKLFSLAVASISILGFERKQPAIKLWNDTHYLEGSI